MKVLFVSSGTTEAGIAPFIRSQAQSLRDKGLDVDLFTITHKGIKGYLKSINILRDYLKDKKYNIIHAHYGLSGWVCVLARTKIPVVISFMGSDVYGDVDLNGKRTWYSIIILSKLLQPLVKAIIVKSKNILRYIYLKKKSHIVPNGVNFEIFKPLDLTECREKLGLPLNKKIVLFLGNTEDPRKNFKLTEQAVQQLADENVELVTPYPIPHAKVPLYLNAADVMALTSHLEGSPNVVKEAMACNCPVVVTDAGDAVEVINNTEGCYATSYDAEDAGQKIKAALNFGKRTNGRKDIQHLDEREIAEKIVSIYRTIT